jgi:DNA topoisomerase-1
VQAWGLDAKGRKQYRYHARAVERGQLRKYYRVRELAKDLPELRRRIRRHAAVRAPTKRAVAAAVVQLVSESFFRIGSERYVEENRTFGIATLLKRHVEIADGKAIFSYVGKRSIRQRQVVANRALARLVARHLDSPGARLFRYRDGSRWRNLTARDVNRLSSTTRSAFRSAQGFPHVGGNAARRHRARRAGAWLDRRRRAAQRGETMRSSSRNREHAGDLPNIVRTSDRRGAVPSMRGRTVRLPGATHGISVGVCAFRPEERR